MRAPENRSLRGSLKSSANFVGSCSPPLAKWEAKALLSSVPWRLLGSKPVRVYSPPGAYPYGFATTGGSPRPVQLGS